MPNSPDLVKREIAPLQDAQRAMRIIRANAGKWKIDPHKIGVMGTSAGGHLASTLGTHSEDVSGIGDSLDNVPFNPDFMILISPVITMREYTHKGSLINLLGENPSQELIKKYSNELQVSEKTPPCFLGHAYNDNSVSQMNSILFYEALVRNKVPATIHIFPQGGHSIGLHNNPGSTELWTDLCIEWIKEMGLL